MIRTKPGALKETRPGEYIVRFVFGGLACVLAGLVAKKFGPAVGGLFLSFPAIFPASATLIEKHEKRKKGEKEGTPRGRHAAGVEAAGTAIGCFGLATFGLTTWKLLGAHGPLLAIPAAIVSWAVVANGLWMIFRRWIE